MTEMREGAVIAFSGGIDSTTVLGEAVRRYGKANVIAASFFYGQKHRIELYQARDICEVMGVEHLNVDLPMIFKGAGSTLMDDGAGVQVMGTYEELEKKYGAQPTVVPNRNMHIISSCITIALTKGLNRVMLGVHGTDAAHYHYPDCTPAFIGAMQAACEIGNSGQVHLEAPFNTWTKGQIVAYAAAIKVPAALTQSCYSGTRPQCGQCATCHERINAFKEAGFIDPAPYVIPIEWGNLPAWPGETHPDQMTFFGSELNLTSQATPNVSWGIGTHSGSA